MRLSLRIDVAEKYSSPTQRIRVMTEEWVSRAGLVGATRQGKQEHCQARNNCKE